MLENLMFYILLLKTKPLISGLKQKFSNEYTMFNTEIIQGYLNFKNYYLYTNCTDHAMFIIFSFSFVLSYKNITHFI